MILSLNNLNSNTAHHTLKLLDTEDGLNDVSVSILEPTYTQHVSANNTRHHRDAVSQ